MGQLPASDALLLELIADNVAHYRHYNIVVLVSSYQFERETKSRAEANDISAKYRHC